MFAQFSIIALDILLLATLVYLFVLMRKLKVLYSHRDDMRTIISDVIVATESSRDAVARLKSSVIESQSSMANYFKDARQIQSDLDKRIADSRKILADIDAMLGPAMRGADTVRNGTNSAHRTSAPAPEASERHRHPTITSQRADHDIITGPELGETQDDDVRQRLTTLHDTVNHLRSRIMAYS